MNAILALTSAKHAPGTTTAALAFAVAAGPQPVSLVVEADPAGGDLAARCGRSLEPGLGSLAAAGRHGSAIDLAAHMQPLPSGPFGLLAPTSPAQTVAALDTLGPRLIESLRDWNGTVVIDCGRWLADGPGAELASAADALVVIIRPTVEGVEHARVRLDEFRSAGSPALAGVLVGDKPYPPAEVASVLGIPVLGALQLDARGARAVEGHGFGPEVTRSNLVRAARSALDVMARWESPRAEAWA